MLLELGGLAPVIAFQIWDAVGWLGQGLFTLRMLGQWLASERAKKSIVPVWFWWLSLGGSLALLVYQFHRRDPVFLAGVLVNLAIYVRNLVLILSDVRRPRTPKRSPVGPIVVALVAFAMLIVLGMATGQKVMRFDVPLPWLLLGFGALLIWTSRFVVQWVISERAGVSHLPPSFFWLSIVGAVGLFAYAVYRTDPVMMAAYALNPIPYVRNLVLIKREARASAS